MNLIPKTIFIALFRCYLSVLKRSTIIKFSLVGFLCILCFVGFSEDTTNIFTSPSRVQLESQLGPIRMSDIPRDHDVFRVPGQKNPKLAGWLSAAIPGAGQVYNGHWWKVPIIYGGFVGLLITENFYRTERNLFQTELRIRMNPSDTISIPNPNLAMYSTEQIKSARDFYRRNQEWVYIFTGMLYLLNIIDAVVFAHLATFDVSDNLTMRVEPFASPDLSPFAFQQQRMPMQGGLRLTFTLK